MQLPKPSGKPLSASACLDSNGSRCWYTVDRVYTQRRSISQKSRFTTSRVSCWFDSQTVGNRHVSVWGRQENILIAIPAHGMIRSFRHRGLRRLYERGDPSRIGADQLDRITLALADLNAASKPSDIDLPAYRLHSLRGWQLRSRNATSVVPLQTGA